MDYAISGGHRKTVEAAKLILHEGGNAVDAAIAAYLVSFVAEPCMASLGAGGFAMINDAKQVRVFDFFCQTPKKRKPVSSLDFFPITVDFGNTTEDFHVGKASAAVPGALAGIYAMHDHYGSMPMRDLMEPARQWAKEGIALDTFQAYDFTLLRDIFALNDGVKHIFFNDDTLKKEGDKIIMDRYADLLSTLAIEGQDLFYKGEIAASISNDMKNGGLLTREDFASYEVQVRKPLAFSFLGETVHTPGFPSVGGMLIAAILNTYQDFVIDQSVNFLSMEHFQDLVRSFDCVQKLKNEKHHISRFLIDNFGINAPVPYDNHALKKGGTSHFNVVDAGGMTVSLTTSIGEGCGYFIPDTDMQMNNMLGEEALLPEGFHRWALDSRLQSMMCPTILTDRNGSTAHALGSGGAGRIPYAISQVLINSLHFGCPPQIAVDGPRIHRQHTTIQCEEGFEVAELMDADINMWSEPSLFFGGVNGVIKDQDRYEAYADGRRFGHTAT